MPSWNHLPVEIKQHVVKKLDFMSRHSLKSTSHLDRLIVNSTCFKVPRVRFGYKEGKCLVMIYTGIDKFLRLELSKCKEGILVERSENTWNSHDITTKILLSSDVLKTGLTILKSLFAHESIMIEAMEWDIPKSAEPEDAILQEDDILKPLKNSRFRIREFIFIWDSKIIENMIEKLCVVEDVKMVRLLGLGISSFFPSEEDILAPQMIYELQRDHPVLKIPCHHSLFHMDVSPPNQLIFHMRAHAVLFSDPNSEVIACHFRIPVPSNRPPHRMEHLGEINWIHDSECGRLTTKMAAKNEERVKKELETQKCGVHYLCKTCTDSFNYWYYQNLPHRILQEPFWNDILYWLPDAENKEQGIEDLKEKLAEEEILNPKETSEVSSWGFRKQDSANSGDAEKRDVTQKPEVLSGFDPQIILVLIVFPILISFVFYLIVSFF